MFGDWLRRAWRSRWDIDKSRGRRDFALRGVIPFSVRLAIAFLPCSLLQETAGMATSRMGFRSASLPRLIPLLRPDRREP